MARQPIQVEVFIFRIADGKPKYLLLRRIPSRGGFWQPVTGGVEDKESLHQTVLREVKEETGIKKISRVTECVHEFKFVMKEGPLVKEFVFGAEVDSKIKITFDKNVYPEHDAHKWCSYSEAMKLLKWPNNKDGLKRLHKLLGV